jgi:hypothetical protein
MRKAGKERGQNLKPFILNLLANILAPSSNNNLINKNNNINLKKKEQQKNFSNSPSLESKSSFNLMKRFINNTNMGEKEIDEENEEDEFKKERLLFLII